MVKDWVERSIDELFDISGGFSASRAQLSVVGHPYLHYGDIHGSIRTFVDVCADNTIPCLDVPLNKVSKGSLLQDGDVVFVDASEDDEGASRHIVVRNEELKPFISGLHTIVAKAKTDELDNRYREFCFQTKAVKAQFRFYAVGTKVLGVSKTTIKNISVRYPSDKSEQRAIAAALSDTDAYISALEKLIAKKLAVKQGAMQELLTGKRRLPGFNGKWVEKQLGDVLKVGHGKSQHEIEVKGGKYPILATSGEIGRTNSFLYDKPSVLIGRKGTINKPQYMDTPFWTIDTLFYTIINCDAYHKYIFYLFCTINWSNLNEASGVPSLSTGIIENLYVLLPNDINEQTAIATILSDMDAEIDALKAKLNKARQIKQGMMQELLTGKIRLVEQDTLTQAVAAPKTIKLPEQGTKGQTTATKNHNKAIEDAVILAIVTDLYATEQYPLTPFYAQKFPYLLHRHMEGIAKGYHKLAAGPYNAELKYKTAFPIAKTNKYVTTRKNTYKGTTYLAMVVGDNIEQAKNYFSKWHGEEPIEWLKQFKTISVASRRNELELLTTVDMAMVELRQSNKPVTVQTVKQIIENSDEWKAKLKREIFSDANIARAINWSNDLFGSEI